MPLTGVDTPHCKLCM